MNAALWISKTGLSAQDAEMSAIANNIANVNTTGFKRDRVMFQDLFYQTQEAPGAMLDQNNIMPTGMQFGSGVRIVGTQKTFTEGNVETTDNTMNVAIMGQGFWQVQKANGDIAYTRDGNMQVNADGVLTNSEGLPLQPEIDVPSGATNVAFGEDGTVTAILPGDSDPTELGQLTLVNFANPAGLSAEGDNLYLETEEGEKRIAEVKRRPAVNRRKVFRGKMAWERYRIKRWKARTWTSSTKWWR